MPDSGSHKTTGRSLPSWMSARDNDKKSDHEEPADDKGKRHAKPHTSQTHTEESSLDANKPSKLLEGVMFALSGFVNPERSTLRSQALEMGAKYQADWNPNCTLLVCAFPNTPKFRQVEADGGTIVSKGWITECYNQKQLVDIEPHLLHAGKPWRRQNSSTGASPDKKRSLPKNSHKQVDKSAETKPVASASSKTPHKCAKNEFLTSEVKKWAIDDLNGTISWLDRQDEKPDPSEITKIAAEGILTCLQDAIDSLKEEQGMEKIIEQWNFVPRVVEELNKLITDGDGSKKEVYHKAIACKRVYEFELGKLENDKTEKGKRPKIETEDPGYDSDDTIEMTEDEIREAFNTVASSMADSKQFTHR